MLSNSRLVVQVLPVLVLVAVVTTSSSGVVGIGVCERGCNGDDSCTDGLYCSGSYISQLEERGYDPTKVNCPIRSSFGDTDGTFVCFNPSTIFTEQSVKSATATGDPHFQTYDGTQYSYHGQCDLIMAKSIGFNSGMGLEIHARTDIQSDSWSLISSIAIKIGTDIFEVTNDGTYYYNGIAGTNGDSVLMSTIQLMNEFPVTFAEEIVKYDTDDADQQDAGASSSSSSSSSLPTNESESVIVPTYVIKMGKERGNIYISSYKKMMTIRLDTYLHDAVGMLGHRTINGMIGRDGITIYTDPNRMGADWQVRTDTDPILFNNTNHIPQYPEQCIVPSTAIARQRRRLRHSQHEIDRATKACAKVADGTKQFCIDDVLQTGDVSMAFGYGIHR